MSCGLSTLCGGVCYNNSNKITVGNTTISLSLVGNRAATAYFMTHLRGKRPPKRWRHWPLQAGVGEGSVGSSHGQGVRRLRPHIGEVDVRSQGSVGALRDKFRQGEGAIHQG